jgi:hypothetical protein
LKKEAKGYKWKSGRRIRNKEARAKGENKKGRRQHKKEEERRYIIIITVSSSLFSVQKKYWTHDMDVCGLRIWLYQTAEWERLEL